MSLNYRREKLLPWACGTAFGLVLLGLAVREANLSEIVHTLGKTEPGEVSVAVLFLFLSFWLRAWRWQYLLVSLKPVPVSGLFRSTLIGFMGNYLLPLRAGELMRAVSLGQTQNISKSSALGSIVLERLLDGLTLWLVPFLLVASLDLPAWIVRLNAVLFGTYVIGVIIITFGSIHDRAQSVLTRVSRLLPKKVGSRLAWTTELFFQGTKGLSRSRAIFPVACLSLLCWLLHGMYYYLLFKAVDLNLSLWVALILQAVIGIAVILPGGPGYLGNFEYGTVVGLALFGIAAEEAFAYSIVAHSFQFFPVVLVGLWYAFRGGFWHALRLTTS